MTLKYLTQIFVCFLLLNMCGMHEEQRDHALGIICFSVCPLGAKNGPYQFNVFAFVSVTMGHVLINSQTWLIGF